MEYSEKVIDHYTNPRNVGKIENASGAGDALMSGIIYGIYHSYSIKEAIKTGIKWAGLTCSVKNAVYEERIENK